MRVLVAEDDAVSRRLLEKSLERWGYDPVLSTNGREALDRLVSEDGPCLAILDWMMPELDGVEVCRRLRRRGEEPYVYVILLTARSQKEDLVLGMEAGADDYLVKPFDPTELRVRLRAGRRILDLQMQLIAARERLREQATHDTLTLLYNHTAVLDVLRREVARGLRERAPLSVIMVDIDHFKAVNDTHGHVAGDEVLHEVADRLRDAVREYDTLGRYGGEEFLVILPNCDAESGLGAANRLREAIGGRPVTTSRGEMLITASMGLATAPGDRPIDGSVLVRAADEALYRAKSLGRDRAESATADDLLAQDFLRHSVRMSVNS